MDYYCRIQKSINFIETNLNENVNIVEIASKAFFSAFHFQRIFQAICGFSVQGYVRKRRLTEAAILLKESNKSILEIALNFQYNSQEAFTRAFEINFGITPAKYRKIGKSSLKITKKVDFLNYKKQIQGNVNVDKPNIISKEKIQIIGYEYKTSLNEEVYFKEIPKFYDDFGKNEYYMKIPKRVAPGVSYGISYNYYDDGKFSFIVGEAVSSPNKNLESGFLNIEIPKGKYAKFKIKGSIEVAKNTWKYIYGTWLLNSNYELRDGLDFEVIDVCNSVYPNNMIMEIYIPIK